MYRVVCEQLRDEWVKTFNKPVSPVKAPNLEHQPTLNCKCFLFGPHCVFESLVQPTIIFGLNRSFAKWNEGLRSVRGYFFWYDVYNSANVVLQLIEFQIKTCPRSLLCFGEKTGWWLLYEMVQWFALPQYASILTSYFFGLEVRKRSSAVWCKPSTLGLGIGFFTTGVK